MPSRPLPYQPDICRLFSRFAAERRAVLLDSGSSSGRFDIFSAWPVRELRIDSDGIHLIDSDKNDQPLADLAALIEQLMTGQRDAGDDLPFTGGWLGFAGFELGYWLENAAGQPRQAGSLPLFQAGYYPWAVVQDHSQQCCQLVWREDIDPALLARVERQLAGPPPALPAFVLDEPFRPLTPVADYRRAIARIHDYIVAGDCYQVNYAMPFSARYHGHSFAAYCRLRDTVPSPYMAYINAGRQQILSISPECFIEASGNRLSSRPIKGTAARAADAGQDRQQAEALQQSAKNRAENVMIVDLIRNDFSRFSQPHSVQVEALCQLESYANVHHLVSTVNAELAAPYTVWDVFFASFPGGSITGAPKIRACQIINELEQHNREIYCGSVFAASDNGRFSASIAIRTLLCDNGRISAWAGGGIVADSTADEEYQECLNKIGALLDAL